MNGSDRPIKEFGAIRFAVERYVLVFGFFLGFVLIGLLSALGLGVNLYPSLTVPVVAISTAFPGGAPTDLDRQVTRPIENAVSAIANVASVQSSSGNGLSSVIINFRPGVNIDAAVAEVSQRVSDARAELPDAVKAPIVQKFDINAAPILSIAVTGAKDLQAAREYANNSIRPTFERLPGVAAISLSGVPDRRIEVRLDPVRLATYNLSPAQVTGALSSSALDLPAGRLQEGSRETTFSTRNIPSKLSDIEGIRIDSSRSVRIADVASVLDAEAKATQYSRLNGQPALFLDVRKLPNANTVSVAGAVRGALGTIQPPTGVKLTVLNDSSQFIRHSVEDTLKEGVLVAIAVAIICLLALGKINTAIAVILALPISLAAAPIVMNLIGASFNIMTLLALIVAMGIVVDDSIVVAENVERYRRGGASLIDSVLKGTSEIFSAVSAATWSLMAVLLPLSFLPGIIGQFFREFALVLAAAVFLSWLEAIFFLTVRMAYTPDPKPVTWHGAGQAIIGIRGSLSWVSSVLRQPLGWVLVLALGGLGFAVWSWWGLLLIAVAPIILGVMRHLLAALYAIFAALVQSLHLLIEAGLEHLRGFFERSLRVALKARFAVIGLAVVFLFSAALTKVSFSFQPRTDDNLAVVNLRLPSGSSLPTTEAIARRIERFFLTNSAVDNMTANISANTASFTLELVSKSKRDSVFVLTERWQNELTRLLRDRPEAEIRVGNGSEGGGLRVSLSAAEQSDLESTLPRVLSIARAQPGVIGVSSSLSDTAPERIFIPDAARLERTGLTPADVSSALRGFLEGDSAGTYRHTTINRNIPIVVQLEEGAIRDAQTLENLPVFAPTLNANLPLNELGRFELGEAPATLERLNKRAVANLTINVANGVNALELQTNFETKLRQAGIVGDRIALVNTDSTSDAALAGDLTTAAPLAILLAVILNYLVLGAQFNSFKVPFYLLVPVPLAVVGALWTLTMFGVGLDVIAVLGMVILVGLVTKNSILLLDFVIEQSKSGADLLEALVHSGSMRLRPIIMTTLTVLVISIPLVLGAGEGAELRRGLGLIILGGLLTGTVLTLYVVPALFYTLEKRNFEKPRALSTPPAMVATD